MKDGVWSKRLIPEVSIFLMTTRLRKSASKQATTQKTTYCHPVKKNLTVLKKQQHMAGWGVSERNIVITFEHSLYRLGEKGHFLGENVERSQSLSFESTIENGKGKEGFVPG